MKALLCWLGGHKPQYDKPVEYETHYPFPCKCGRMFTAHRDENCNCAEVWARENPPAVETYDGSGLVHEEWCANHWDCCNRCKCGAQLAADFAAVGAQSEETP